MRSPHLWAWHTPSSIIWASCLFPDEVITSGLLKATAFKEGVCIHSGNESSNWHLFYNVQCLDRRNWTLPTSSEYNALLSHCVTGLPSLCWVSLCSFLESPCYKSDWYQKQTEKDKHRAVGKQTALEYLGHENCWRVQSDWSIRSCLCSWFTWW